MKFIDTASDLYKKRLAKQIKIASTESGAYYGGNKVINARFNFGKLQVKCAAGAYGWESVAVDSFDAFVDGNGQDIVASRE